MTFYSTENHETFDGSQCSSLLSGLDNDPQSDSSDEVLIGQDEWPPSDEDTTGKDYIEARLEDHNKIEADNKQPVSTLKAKQPITDIDMKHTLSDSSIHA
jgi:hypothetical protein